MNIAVIGAGPAGIEAASILASGHSVTIFEKESAPLANIRDKALLFPDFSSASDLADRLEAKLKNDNIVLHTATEVLNVQQDGGKWIVETAIGGRMTFDFVIMATGYKTFDARKKEELGYGIYKGVITSVELERMIKENSILNNMNETPKQIVFLQCVGSRDEKSGNNYCSKVCCVTAVKQAIEVKRQHPSTDVYVYYMDLRMWGEGFEEMYREAQETYGVNFVRGRISEASGTFDKRVQIKAEDTLLGTPLTMNCDLLVLMVGMCASEGTAGLGRKLGIDGMYGFVDSKSPHLDDNASKLPGLFLAGSCKRPMCISDTVNDARSAAVTLLRSL